MQKLIKREYIKNEILTLTILGGLGRSSVYKKAIQEADRNDLKSFLRKKLGKYSKIYKSRVDEKHHINNIKIFSRDVTNKYPEILKNDRFRIGIAQKLLNLYLKYLWVLGWIFEPPHCPFDDKIISKLGLKIKWTKMDSIEDYKRLVGRVREIANDNGLSIAEWELKMWSRK